MTSQETQSKIREILKKHQEHGVRYAVDEIVALIEKREKEALGLAEDFYKHAIFNLHWIHDPKDRGDVQRVITAHYSDFLEYVKDLSLPIKEENQK